VSFYGVIAVIEMSLRQEDAKLVYLAVAYHLGRPGSELDPTTKQPVAHGLAEVARILQPQLSQASVRTTLNGDQLGRLTSAMLGTITELKAYNLQELRPAEEGGGRRSSVPGFDRTLRHLFPRVDDDIETAMDIAQHMIMLKRRLDEKIVSAPPIESDTAPRRGRWPFRR
jgi:hypothetical protein